MPLTKNNNHTLNIDNPKVFVSI